MSLYGKDAFSPLWILDFTQIHVMVQVVRTGELEHNCLGDERTKGSGEREGSERGGHRQHITMSYENILSNTVRDTTHAHQHKKQE